MSTEYVDMTIDYADEHGVIHSVHKRCIESNKTPEILEQVHTLNALMQTFLGGKFKIHKVTFD